MRYYAQVIVDGWVEVEVEAENEAEAVTKMNDVVATMGFGNLRDAAWNMDEAEIERLD